jgi:hypothetical protein
VLNVDGKLGSARYIWKDKIKKERIITEITCEFMDMIRLTQDRHYWQAFVCRVMDFQVS